MDDPPSSGPDSVPAPEPTPTPRAGVFLGSVTPRSTTPGVYRPYQRAPEPAPPFWASDWFKGMVFLLVAGAAAGWAYYHFFWLYRLPQERDLRDLQGNVLPVRILGHDDTLLKYTVSGSERERYLSLATLSPSDQEFIAKLSSAPLAKLPFACTLTDSTGRQTSVRVLAHDSDWAQCSLIADGSTHYVFLASLIPADQAVVRLLPVGLDLAYPLDYTFTGAPEPGAKIQILGRNENIVEYLELDDGQRYFTAITNLSKTDQSLVRELPVYMMDKPPAATASAPEPSADTAKSKLAYDASRPNAPLNASQLKALVIIEGDYSAGSGFVAKMHGDYFVVTNQHVLSGNKKFTITSMDGKKLPTDGPLYGATDYDVALLKIPESLAQNYLEIMDDPQSNAKIGDPIAIPGNSLGARVPTQITGQLTAIGPELVEVSAQLVHGISGSPIIDRPSGKVVGIATMSITYKYDADKHGLTADTRWFGYRVDNIDPNKGWVKMDWKRFSDEGLKVRAAVDLYTSLDAVLQDDATIEIASQPVHTALMELQTDVGTAKAHNNKQEMQSVLQNFNHKLQSLADNGTTELTSATLYPYHAKIIKELNDLRQYMDQAFEDNNRQFNNLLNLNR
jgi:hypothetical protein